MNQLLNKVIFITGGASGIGLACAEAYIREGATVFIMDVNERALYKTLDRFGGNHEGIPGDVSKAADVKAAFDAIKNHYGRLDAIHNNAAIAHPSKPVDETEEGEWDALMNINLKSLLWTTKYGIDLLKASKGCILNTSSMAGDIGQSLHAAYTATKGGINALTKSMALDYAPYGIRVNAVSPAGVWTPLLKQWAAEQPDPGSIEKYLNDIHALGYCPEGDVVADAAVFLLSDAARFVTGCIMPVSGGAELGYRR
ncbi:SDR family NAD(P)-dependent oxidoreductase [Mucilaginibacter sp. NFR10]|jgi:NAD(P)-dependent dehydrogenase (short-subunit alcohol dehydrogenase family)|uniref:SDR family NAD(P)-dependent oxidoreductase n=1 Tax=Mucilaginibacter sp. NFR10 TaxID=1566292 RepID=UPI0008719C20|nr:SDR family oxidoreductase [Mucilaginibacter sp. NFR10]SCW40236.1 NAD(P)-dependent dehydrogenase, short-chain alcohol dehydrogenase family [Mucilaginibacter sp. NFR10]